MIGRKDRSQDELFVACSLRELIPDDHVLKRVDRVVDLSWLRDEVRNLYNEREGRPSIDPEAAVRLMLAGFFQGIVHDRALMREAQVNLAIRWFVGYELHERLPHHSSLTRIRQRWGSDRFREIFRRTVQACVEAGLVDGGTVHIDASLIRADVSWESLTTEYVDRVFEENADETDYPGDHPGPGNRVGARRRRERRKKRSATDPDATMATSRSDQRLEPSYKQHTAVDDRAGVVVHVEVTTGETSEGGRLISVMDEVEASTGIKIGTVTADGAYGHSANYESLESRGVDAVIPPQRAPRRRHGRIPLSRFKYDGKQRIVRCPAGRTLRRRRRQGNGWLYQARSSDCGSCPLRRRCFSATAKSRSIVIVDGYEALLRARRRRLRWGEREQGLYTRHRWRAEGAHGEAKTMHGLRRAVRRGLANVAIQVYLTAAVMNLKRLAGALARLFSGILPVGRGARPVLEQLRGILTEMDADHANPLTAEAC